MRKHLFFICPTDYLETAINSSFNHENYFSSSLGNSVCFTADSLGQIIEFIRAENISEISFILSCDNQIVSESLKSDHSYFGVTGMINFSNQLKWHQEQVQLVWQEPQASDLLLSYHLHQKMDELKSHLEKSFRVLPKISGFIYNKRNNVFTEVYNDLVYKTSLSLN